MKPSFNKINKVNNTDKTSKSNKTKKHKGAKPASENLATNPISANAPQDKNNQIISGYFLDEKPYKEMIIQRVNNFLYAVLGVLVICCFIFYYFVSCKEVQLNRISTETLEINYENDELQNKLDSLQSYYNIDKAVSKANILERATKVVEVDAIDLPNLNFSSRQNKSKPSLVVSY